MKKQITKQNRQANKKCRLWLWIIMAFVFGGIIGYAGHYTIVNWDGFFAICPDGNRPDNNGCCGNEVYTDAGDGWMVCCPDGGDNCFPPIK